MMFWCSYCKLAFLLPCIYGASLSSYFKKLVKNLPFSTAEELLYANLVDKPELSIFRGPKSQNVTEGSAVVLKCEATGIPQPRIHWLKDGARQHPHESYEDTTIEMMTNYGHKTHQQGATSGVLKIPCARFEDESTYTCVAENGVEKVNAEAVVKVEPENDVTKETSAECGRIERWSPQIYMWTDMRIERGGVNVQLFCRARGNPKPRIYWTDYDGKPLRNGPLYKILPNGDLLIKLLQRKRGNDGTFRCNAANKHGRDSVDSFVLSTKYDGEDELGAGNVPSGAIDVRRRR